MSKSEIIERLRQAMLNYDEKAAEDAARDAVKAGVDPVEVIEKGLAEGIREVGERFEKGECFLPHLVMAADIMEKATAILQEKISTEELKKTKKGTIVIATVEGDLHDLGKNVVMMMLKANGFEVYDLGKDVRSDTIINKAKEINADIIGLSSLMSTTRPYQRELVDELKRLGLKDRFIVMIGGGPVTKEWAKSIGADGYGYNARNAVEEAQRLMEEKSKHM